MNRSIKPTNPRTLITLREQLPHNITHRNFDVLCGGYVIAELKGEGIKLSGVIPLPDADYSVIAGCTLKEVRVVIANLNRGITNEH